MRVFLGEQGSKSLLVFIAITFFCTSLFAQAKYEIIPGEYIVKLKKAHKTMDLMGGLMGAARSQLHIKETLASQDEIYLVNSTNEEELFLNPAVEYVEPNYAVHILGQQTPREVYQHLWGLMNLGRTLNFTAKWYDDNSGELETYPVTSAGNFGIDIKAPEAWKISMGSKNVVVAIIDTGVNFDLPDLEGQAWINLAEANGKPGVDDDGNGYIDDIHGYDFIHNTGRVTDDNGHGTHCAGIIGAKADDKGVVGVSPHVSIMALKFLDKSGRGNLAMAVKAIDYATKMGAHIMNNSWDGGPKSSSIQEAIERANEAGILFVAAAGNGDRRGQGINNDIQPSYPASFTTPNVISVAALQNNGRLTTFSNYGNSVHLAAPGFGILSLAMDYYFQDNGLVGKRWSEVYFNGTSMAAPFVTGVAALLKAQNPHISAIEMKRKILSSVTPLPSLKGKIFTGGLLNAVGALKQK